MPSRLRWITTLTTLVLLLTALSTSPGPTPTDLHLTVNGRPATASPLLHRGTPYIPLDTLTQVPGITTTYDPQTRTATIQSAGGTALHDLTEPVDFFQPTIDLAPLGLRAEQVDAAKLEQDGRPVDVEIELADSQLRLRGPLDTAGGNVLDPARRYTLKLYAADGTRHQVTFTTGGLPPIVDADEKQVLFVPAMPEQGFHWPYYLLLPSRFTRALNEGHRRYLMVDTTNTGNPTNDVRYTLLVLTAILEAGHLPSLRVADALGLPVLMPALPRPLLRYKNMGEIRTIYTHAFDRDTATLHLMLQDPDLGERLRLRFAEAGFAVEDFAQLDRQVLAMIDHAVGYLNQYGQGVEPGQVFLLGHSASGMFTDRFAALHPERVKAVASLSTLDDMVLPLAEYRGEELIFPIGVGDYEAIAGKPFDLEQHNRVARVLYMGALDPNNTAVDEDCYGDRERRLIASLWGVEMLPRAEALIRLYGEAGGRGIFILDEAAQHTPSPEMSVYLTQFFAANRDSDEPVYPIPEDPEQLKYTLYE